MDRVIIHTLSSVSNCINDKIKTFPSYNLCMGEVMDPYFCQGTCYIAFVILGSSLLPLICCWFWVVVLMITHLNWIFTSLRPSFLLCQILLWNLYSTGCTTSCAQTYASCFMFISQQLVGRWLLWLTFHVVNLWEEEMRHSIWSEPAGLVVLIPTSWDLSKHGLQFHFAAPRGAFLLCVVGGGDLKIYQ